VKCGFKIKVSEEFTEGKTTVSDRHRRVRVRVSSRVRLAVRFGSLSLPNIPQTLPWLN